MRGTIAVAVVAGSWIVSGCESTAALEALATENLLRVGTVLDD